MSWDICLLQFGNCCLGPKKKSAIVNHFNKCRPRDFRRHVLSTFKTPLLPVPPTAAEAEIIGKAFKRNKYVWLLASCPKYMYLKINMYGNHWGRASCDPVPPAQPAPGSAQICNSFKRATKSLQAVCSALFNSRGLYSIYTSLWQIQYLVENYNKYYIVPTILCWSNFINCLIKISNHF